MPCSAETTIFYIKKGATVGKCIGRRIFDGSGNMVQFDFWMESSHDSVDGHGEERTRKGGSVRLGGVVCSV